MTYKWRLPVDGQNPDWTKKGRVNDSDSEWMINCVAIQYFVHTVFCPPCILDEQLELGFV